MRLKSLLFTGVIFTLFNHVAFADDIVPNEFSKQFQSCVAQDDNQAKAIDCEENEIMRQQDLLKRVMTIHYTDAKGYPQYLAAFKKEESKFKAYEDALCGDVVETRLEGASPGPMMYETNLCSMRLGRDHLIDLERSTH